MKRFYALLLLALAAGLFFPMTALADGVIIIDPPPLDRPAYLTVVYHHVEITIADQVATTKIDQVFRNDNDFAVEGTYLFPLPDEAAIERFVMYVNGEPLEGKVLDRDEARAIYESIVRQNRDPALLEYVGRDCFQASIFPISPHEEKRIQIEYRQVLPMDQGLVEYVYPLSTERFSPQPIEDVAVTVYLSSKDPLKAVYSPSHDVSVTRPDDYHATLSYEARDVLPDRDFVLYYTVSTAEFGLNLLTYRPHGEDGFFLLLVAPPVEAGDREVVAKDVIFVLDTSGSMEGEKIEQARNALIFVLDHLNGEDRFAIVAFNSAITTYADELQPASERAAARKYVEGIAAGGSTDLDGALRRALELADNAGGRPQVVLFLTDGLPTVGEQEPAVILENARARSGENVRLFPFGVGYDVNSALLDSLAQENHGASAYVLPGENLEERVSAFYSKITSPVLAGLTLDLGGIVVEDAYPNPLPDLFLGSQLVLVGRYRGSGRVTVTLRGTVNGEARSYVYEGLDFPEEDTNRDFLPRLWATRKIGYLLSEIRLHSEDKEIIDEIVALSLRYGVITPYTSFLVDETGDVLTREGREEAKGTFDAALPSAAPAVGSGGVDYSMESQNLAESDGAYSGYATTSLRQVGDKAFLLANGVWTDTTYEPGSPTTRVTFGSDSYFALIAAHPEWGKYLAVGQHVIVILDGTAYEVVTEDVPPVTVPPVTEPPAVPHTTPYPESYPPSSAEQPASFPLGWVIAGGALVLGLAAGAVLLLRRAR
jgi:Ca-activated chloride channel family protein